MLSSHRDVRDSLSRQRLRHRQVKDSPAFGFLQFFPSFSDLWPPLGTNKEHFFTIPAGSAQFRVLIREIGENCRARLLTLIEVAIG